MSAADAAKKRAAVLKMRDEALEDFYATKPEIKEELAKAVGYAVFDASQVNVVLFVGGLGGGVLVENGTGKRNVHEDDTRRDRPRRRLQKFRQLMVFKDRTLFDQFRTLGADVGASADATMKIGGKGVAVDPNVSFNPQLSDLPDHRQGRVVAGELGRRRVYARRRPQPALSSHEQRASF